MRETNKLASYKVSLLASRTCDQSKRGTSKRVFSLKTFQLIDLYRDTSKKITNLIKKIDYELSFEEDFTKLKFVSRTIGLHVDMLISGNFRHVQITGRRTQEQIPEVGLVQV